MLPCPSPPAPHLRETRGVPKSYKLPRLGPTPLPLFSTRRCPAPALSSSALRDRSLISLCYFQIQGEAVASLAGQVQSTKPKYRGMLGTLLVISREEGPRALYSGLSAGLQRQMAFGAIRIGLYDMVKQGYINLFQGQSTVLSSDG